MSQAEADPSGPIPCHDLIESWLGDSMYDFQLRAGDDVVVDADDPEAVAAARRFRDVLGRFASGVTVVTSVSAGAPVGLTCQSFSSVSLNPPLVLFVPAKTSRAWPAIHRSGSFCVNFLAEAQADLSNQMAGRAVDKFAGVEWTPTASTGSPLLSGVLGHVDCHIQAVYDAGDHDVVIGRVLELGTGDPSRPLLFFEGSYTSTEPRR